jgi:hypothetical protein
MYVSEKKNNLEVFITLNQKGTNCVLLSNVFSTWWYAWVFVRESGAQGENVEKHWTFIVPPLFQWNVESWAYVIK